MPLRHAAMRCALMLRARHDAVLAHPDHDVARRECASGESCAMPQAYAMRTIRYVARAALQ